MTSSDKSRHLITTSFQRFSAVSRLKAAETERELTEWASLQPSRSSGNFLWLPTCQMISATSFWTREQSIPFLSKFFHSRCCILNFFSLSLRNYSYFFNIYHIILLCTCLDLTHNQLFHRTLSSKKINFFQKHQNFYETFFTAARLRGKKV